MIRFQRPMQPEGFDDHVVKARESVEGALASGQSPVYAELWKDLQYKQAFSEAQHGKCGYCERMLLVPGHMDHYRPKGGVEELENPGEELANLPNFRGRSSRKVSDTGYWWLAYEWSNFVLSCERCNRLKAALFPVREEPRPEIPVHVEDTWSFKDTPLLLNPFECNLPGRHFSFTEVGTLEVARCSERGKKTIETCALDRPTLRKARSEKAVRAFHLVSRLLTLIENKPSVNDPHLRESIADLVDMGRSDREFAGMVRAIAEEHLAVSWEQLEKVIARFEW